MGRSGGFADHDCGQRRCGAGLGPDLVEHCLLCYPGGSASGTPAGPVWAARGEKTMKFIKYGGLLAMVVFLGIFSVAIAPHNLVISIAAFSVIAAIAVVGRDSF